MLHLKRLNVIMQSLETYLNGWAGEGEKQGKEGGGTSKKAEVMTVAELMEKLGKKAAGINLLEIVAYLRSSKVGFEHHIR
jgi:chromosome transmission fidelity protein 1